jgi:sugar phosphate isomerase/epimerase
MKLSFTTLACPAWDLPTICCRAREYGYDAIDFRGLQETLDVTALPAFNIGVAATRKLIADAGLEVSGISSSLTVCDDAKRAANIEEARRTIPVALALGCRNIRLFGGGDINRLGRQGAAEVGRRCIEQILGMPDAEKLNWLLETHDNWVSVADCKLLLDAISHPAFGALWDMGQTPRCAGETPAQTWAGIGSRIRYTHIKDAMYDPNHPLAISDGWRYTAPGEGSLPLADAIKLLNAHGYQGYLVLEHEKRWLPKLPEPEEILPGFPRWVRAVLAQ